MKNTKYEIRNTKLLKSVTTVHWPRLPAGRQEGITDNCRGVAAVMAIIILVLFSILGLVICSLVGTRSYQKARFLESSQALQIAEAGRQYAVWHLTTQDYDWDTNSSWTSEQTLGKGSWRVMVENDTQVVVTSRGFIPDETNSRAQREIKMVGDYEIEVGENATCHPLYYYALYTDSQDTGDSPLVFDTNEYTLETILDNDGDADIHSNETITFLNGSGRVIDGSVYSAKQIDISGWSGTPWRVGYEEDRNILIPPHLGVATKDWYRERAQTSGTYHSGDQTFSGLVELGLPESPALIFVEGKVEIGNVTYYRPGQTNRYGVGTIVSGGGDITITGPIKPASGVRSRLALVSFFDTVYDPELTEPPYYEGTRRSLTMQDSSGGDELSFGTSEDITIKYTDRRAWYGFLSVFGYDENDDWDTYLNDAPMTRTQVGSNYEYSYSGNTGALPDADWYYFRVRTYARDNPPRNLRRESFAHIITGSPASPQHSIQTYKDAGFSEVSSGFLNQADVYLKVYAESDTAVISEIQVSEYNTANPPYDCTPTIPGRDGNYITCRFTLPLLTEDWWYNLVVTTDDDCYFYKQIYIQPPGPTEIYACIYANNFFRLEKSADLTIIGNLASRQGLKLATTPLSQIRVTYDTRQFRRNLNNENALSGPGAIYLDYTWREVK